MVFLVAGDDQELCYTKKKLMGFSSLGKRLFSLYFKMARRLLDSLAHHQSIKAQQEVEPRREIKDSFTVVLGPHQSFLIVDFVFGVF
jgi:hypothetical protein